MEEVHDEDLLYLDGVPRQDLMNIPKETARKIRREEMLQVVGRAVSIMDELHNFERDILRARS